MNTNTDLLSRAGWVKQPDGRWLSPLTNRPHPECTALMLAGLPAGVTLASQVTPRPRHRGVRPK